MKRQLVADKHDFPSHLKWHQTIRNYLKVKSKSECLSSFLPQKSKQLTRNKSAESLSPPQQLHVIEKNSNLKSCTPLLIFDCFSINLTYSPSHIAPEQLQDLESKRMWCRKGSKEDCPVHLRCLRTRRWTVSFGQHQGMNPLLLAVCHFCVKTLRISKNLLESKLKEIPSYEANVLDQWTLIDPNIQ